MEQKYTHSWKQDTCEKCGDKDWCQDTHCPVPDQEQTLDDLIADEHKRLGFDGNYVNDTPEEMPKADEPYDGVRFFINVNDAKDGESVTMHVVHGTWSRRENKRRLRMYLSELGYTKHDEQKRILKALGFWSKKQLGTIA